MAFGQDGIHGTYIKISNLIQVKKCLNCAFCFNPLFAQEDFSNCSAVLFNNQMFVGEYSNNAKCKILKYEKGLLSTAAVSLGDFREENKGFQIKEKFEFGVAIKDGKTGTIILYSSKTYKKISVEKYLAKCKKGDFILIITKDVQFALPYNYLLVY